jgi:hypothetical protein
LGTATEQRGQPHPFVVGLILSMGLRYNTVIVSNGDAAATRYHAELHIVVMNQDMGEPYAAWTETMLLLVPT